MLQPLQSPLAPAAGPPASPGAPAASPANEPTRSRTAFAAALAAATTREAGAGQRPSAGPPTATAQPPRASRPTFPDGETWEPVTGARDQAKILTGPRKGLFLDLSRGARRGQAFSIVERNGQSFRAYGSGAEREEVKVDSAASSRASDGRRAGEGRRPPPGESWTPVEGQRNYARILSGPRKGLFVNLSGNLRDGMAFRVVERDGRRFHVYGGGADRQEVEVGRPRRPGGGERTAGARETGGVAAPAGAASGGVSAPAEQRG